MPDYHRPDIPPSSLISAYQIETNIRRGGTIYKKGSLLIDQVNNTSPLHVKASSGDKNNEELVK
jgi:hypothetical protein